MDRREALKKLGAGGAVAVSAATIVSSPAFAFTAPTPPANPFPLTPTLTPIVPLNFGINRDLTVTFGPNPADARCPGSALPSGSATIVSGAFTASISGFGSPTVSAASGTPGAANATVTFRRGTFGEVGFGATATIVYAVRYRCSYARPGSADACRTWTITFQAPNLFTDWSLTPSITSTSSCP
jgi:hypothetical protein